MDGGLSKDVNLIRYQRYPIPFFKYLFTQFLEVIISAFCWQISQPFVCVQFHPVHSIPFF
jgi:hypothetical protein